MASMDREGPGKVRPAMRAEDAALGMRVCCVRPFAGVPIYTEGVIDAVDGDLWVVAWDHPERRLPAGYDRYDGKPAIATGIRRDGFSAYELRWLSPVVAGAWKVKR
jgi:hypothetical protein